MRSLFPWLAALSLAGAIVLCVPCGRDDRHGWFDATVAQADERSDDAREGRSRIATGHADAPSSVERDVPGAEQLASGGEVPAAAAARARGEGHARTTPHLDGSPAPGEGFARLESGGAHPVTPGLGSAGNAPSGPVAGTALQGIVLDGENGPLANAAVIVRDTLQAPFLPDAEPASTAHDGRFRVEDLRAGEWELEVRAPGFARGRRVVQLPADAGEELRFVLHRVARVRGRVVAPDGSACPRAGVLASGGWLDSFQWGNDTIWVFPPAREPDDGVPPARTPLVEAGDDGRFELVVEPGDVRLSAWAAGHAPASPTDLALAPGEERDGVELHLRRACRLRGSVLDPIGHPLALWLTLRSSDGTRVSLLPGADGVFHASDLPADRWTIAAADRGGHEGSLDVDLAPERETSVVLRLRPLR